MSATDGGVKAQTNAAMERQTEGDINGEMTSGMDTRPNGNTINGINDNADTQEHQLTSHHSNPAFLVSAPGKTIVFGEHAVVHGRAAIAAAISMRSYLLITTATPDHTKAGNDCITLRFPDIGLSHSWPLASLPWAVFHKHSQDHSLDQQPDDDQPTVPRTLDPALLAAIQPSIDQLPPSSSQHKTYHHRAAASAFLYLYLSISTPANPTPSSTSRSCTYALRSTIPVGVGLGSSASISVCLATALLLQNGTLTLPSTSHRLGHSQQHHPPSSSHEHRLALINAWAFVGELLIHGNPSGVDNTVSTYGHAVLFQRKKGSAQPPEVNVLNEWPELPLLIVDTRQEKSTKAEVEKVGALHRRHGQVTTAVFDAIDAITRSAMEAVGQHALSLPQRPAADEEAAKNQHQHHPHGQHATSLSLIPHLGELMTLNHALLRTLGVSHPRLERLRDLVDESGVGWTKLTGAGGGGCAITLLRAGVVSSSQRRSGDRELGGKEREKQIKAAEVDDIDSKIVDQGLVTDASTTSANEDASLQPSTPAKGASSAGGEKSALQRLELQLRAEGFIKYETTLGGEGVGVLSPAMVDRVEVGLESFLDMRGREGIEELVGARGDGGGASWTYWRS